jgi:ubiquinone/menaquinone biosynthesis C-methylase UbiE
VLRDFLRYGALPENCYGIDLIPERIKQAKRVYPNMHFQCRNAERLSFDDNYFDIITCFTVFSSIRNKDMKQKISKEMFRVLRPNGIIIWYDCFRNNPKNPDVKGIKKKEICELFSFCRIFFRRVTLAPPLARMIAPYSHLACYLLEKIKVLNTHYMSIIQKLVTS